MPANLCITPDLGKEDMDPEVSTRMIILSSKANVSESEVVNFLHMLNLPITIKWTFTKERGFAPGDPRRCRGHRYGPREGFHQMEKEFRILDYVGEALKNPREVEIEKKEPVSVDYFKEILEEEENKKEDDK